MTLDVVVPTFNRGDLLRKTLTSLLLAPRPEALKVRIVVVDNNSSDHTESVFREFQHDVHGCLEYILERTQGSSAARNAGIASGNSELIGFVDDDEEVEQNWFHTICTEFADPAVDYIGGPCLFRETVAFPDWLPPGYHSAVGLVTTKMRGAYGPNHPGMLNGGNAVVRRSVFDRIGGFSPRLGRSSRDLLSEEDADLFRRLKGAGLHGVYVPELIIFHHLHENRLTRAYHRKWAYWRGVSQGVLDRDVRERVAYFMGVPRYRIGRALRGLVHLPADRFARGDKAHAFADELACWDLAGFIFGKYFFQEPLHYATKNPDRAA